MTDPVPHSREAHAPAEERLVAEPDSVRTPFQRDRARILHSAGFRRLADKTQVHTAGTDDFLRTRLTHSLEVAQISREMGSALGCDADVVDVAGLAHDLGHPPFGHNGEDALHEVAGPCGGFEGNAQTLRVVSRLEAKVLDAEGRSVGLNLTRASLDAMCKYPWSATVGKRKFGVYEDDRTVFDWMRDGAPEGVKCLEAQVMDWSDDVAYSVHDVEDGLYGGYIDLARLMDDAEEQAAVCEAVRGRYADESAAALCEALKDLLRDPVMKSLHDYDGSLGAQVALKNFTSTMVGRFVNAAAKATEERFGDGRLRRYGADLVVPETERIQCALLKGIAWRYVMRPRTDESWYTRQREILQDLVSVLCDRGPEAMEPVFAEAWHRAGDDAAKVRVAIDQVASLTDASAEAWHRRLTA
ncbi:deoxyguanosinetriphosphate triphosphohydrolase [Glycomyces sp. TRM65418]|uniref:deoxyguanosinetriphosphate triphosphohydrolase n=1 Tax=Glycomyces sp. TRM65418 TaxID=2867006 RepID=UPI001CE61189|nr:deoxyguanosinetriphosphate triphosphohydrolase [Glycomyces sp. TRM65418]MCC3762925.1 deoxyguanosinetriphosphate triphosphohydrolase [Glycomyces sp. TRM65418]QZD56950.1 deoxyguanosinetriphosphate triphosphohydrolase [Glycomyces sp. TRM65418]